MSRQGWQARAVLFGMACLILQRVDIIYILSIPGVGRDDASLAHLHEGLLFAVALLDRDRRVLIGAGAILWLGWALKAFEDLYPLMTYVASFASTVLKIVWMLVCAQWMGWLRPLESAAIERGQLPRMLLIGLVVFPVGLTLSWLIVRPQESMAMVVNQGVQMLFAKHFGVAILTFPLVVAWSERRRGAEPLSARKLRWALLLVLALFASVGVGERIQSLYADATERAPMLMDYRFIVFTALAWCMLHLQPRYSMPILASIMFVLVRSLSGTAEYGATALGFLNLLHIAFELGILLSAMLYLHVIDRDASDLAARLVEETRCDATTRLPNLNALADRLPGLSSAQCEIACLLLDQTDTLAPGFGLDRQMALMHKVAGQVADIAEPFYVGTGQFALLPLRQSVDDDVWQRLIDRVEQIEFGDGEQRIRLLPYLGVASGLSDTRASLDAVLLNASHLAHEAKRRNEVRPLYASEDDELVLLAQRQRGFAATEALSCLRSERVVLYFQPILALSAVAELALRNAGEMHGEVLCRLRSETGELLLPSRFLPAIEVSGRGAELDLAVLRALFSWVHISPQVWPRCGRIAVNLTGQSLASASFRSQVYAMLDKSPLPMSRLCFEIIETAAIVSPAEASAFLGELRRRGCLIAIDDFGVGMQSFERLKELPVDLIKIDGSFIRNVAQRGKDYALVKASVAVARAFGAQTVAEYVENEETVVCLRELGIDWIQGYLVSKPVPIEDAFSNVD